MAKKIRELVVKVGEYQDRNTGETKARWANVGSMMQNDEDGSYFLVLDRTFNPAGVPNPENRANVLVSCFLPKDDNQNGQSDGSGHSGPPDDRGYHPDDRR